MNGRLNDRQKSRLAANNRRFRDDPLAVGAVTVPNRVFLAPMSGITDAPFRRLAARLGAGLVVSEMIASAALAEGGARRSVRSEGAGRRHPRRAACRLRGALDGGRRAHRRGAGRRHHRHQHGLPGQARDAAQSGSALMRDLDHALTPDRGDGRRGRVPVTLKMRLGWDDASLNAPELARRAEAAGVAHDHRARPHALPVLQGPRRLGRGPRGQAGVSHPGRRQWRHRTLRRRRCARSLLPAPTP